MMLLLDTHIFLWYIVGDPKLPRTLAEAISDSFNETYLSVVSVREAVIKHNLGKLPLPGPPAEYLPARRDAHGIATLPVDEGAMRHLADLPTIHRDPFDRLIIAQARQHGMTIVSVDSVFAEYQVSLLSPTATEL